MRGCLRRKGKMIAISIHAPHGGSDRFYLRWCMDNALSPLAQKTVINYLKQNSRQYNLEYTNKISIGDGRFARGFWGIQLLEK